MSTLPSILDILILRIKDRHRACPVNCIIHPTSILYGTRIIISLVMHLRNLSEQTETAVRYPEVSSLFKVGRFHAVLVRTEFARIQGRNPFVRNIYRGGQVRVLFRTEIFYHSTSIFAIAPSVTLDGPQLHRDFQHNML